MDIGKREKGEWQMPEPGLAESTEALLDALSFRVRFLTSQQIAYAFGWNRAPSATEQFLVRLAQKDRLERFRITAHPELELEAPVFVWQPGGELPDCNALSYQCRRRFHRPLISYTVWRVSEKERIRRGGLPPRLRRDQTTHDLHVGLLFSRLFRNSPELAELWRSEEEQLSLPDERLPDALLMKQNDEGDDMRLYKAIEFGGAARSERIAKLHAFGVRYDLPYELW